MPTPSRFERLARYDGLVCAVVSLAVLSVLVAPLATPYWWDAGAVYAPGARWLLDHGFDARPGVFPSDLSRGHTELYYLVLAGVFRVAGPTPTAGHALALFFSTVTLVGTYSLGKRLFGRAQGALAAVLLVVSPLFLTMSSEALPEIPITALTVLALHAFARGAVVESAAWSTALILFKETGIACPLAISLTLGLRVARTGRTRENLSALGVSLVPIAVLAGFFLWQKHAEGWWVLPYHAGLFHEDRSLVTQFVRVTRSIALDDGRGLALAAAVALLALRRVRGEALFGGATPSSEALTAIALVTAQNVGFFTKMFFLERYTLPVHPGVCVLIAAALVPAGTSLKRVAPGLAIVALTVLVALAHRDAGRDVASGETTFRYLTAVRAYGELYRRLEARGGDPVVLTTWPMTDALRSPFLGWVHRPYRVVSYAWHRDGGQHPPIDVIVAAEGLGDHGALTREARALGMHRVERVVERGAAIELWTR